MHCTYTPRGKTKFTFTQKLDSTIQISQQKYNMKITSFYHILPHAGGNKVDCKKTPQRHHSTCSWNQEKYQKCFGKNVQNFVMLTECVYVRAVNTPMLDVMKHPPRIALPCLLDQELLLSSVEL